jgi:hypothetical protein
MGELLAGWLAGWRYVWTGAADLLLGSGDWMEG